MIAADGARRRIVVAALLLLAPMALTGQVPDSAQRPPTRPSDNPDDRYTALQQRVNVQLPILPRLAEGAPEPGFARIVFDRDSIEWVNAETVGDLLARVPGVFIWRGGRRGTPEVANYQARGATSVQYVLDGMPYVPAGPDSVSVDPALFALNFLDRVEIERWPGRLEVRLYTRQHDRLAPRSRIAVATGTDRLELYGGEIEMRSRPGFGGVISGDYVKAPGVAPATGEFSSSQLWVQGSYVPSRRFGMQYQLIRASADRDAFTGGLGGVGERYEGKRTDAQMRVSFAPRTDGAGPRFDLLYARTGWDSAGIQQQINQLGGMLTVRTSQLAGGVSAFQRGRWTSFDSRAWLGFSPAGLLTVSGEAVFQHHFGGRSSRWAGGRAALALPLGLSLGGAVRFGSEVAAPSILSDTAQPLRDVQLTAALRHGWIGGEATYVRGNAYQPWAYQPYPDVAAIGLHQRTEWIMLSGFLAPWRWLVVDGWISDPRGTAPQGQPPRHYAANGTIRSKFLRQFPSGYFELKLQLGVEGWATGTLGTDATGAPVVLPNAHFLRSLVQMEIGSLTFFWDARNILGSARTYVPGFVIPSYNSAFGIRWEFLN
ncbi:MAG: TonB-dependent receptor [Bacillota bacterium]